MLLTGSVWLFWKAFICDSADGGYNPLLIRGPGAPPSAMAPPLPGRECAAIAEHEGTAKAPGTIMFAGAVAEATLNRQGRRGRAGGAQPKCGGPADV